MEPAAGRARPSARGDDEAPACGRLALGADRLEYRWVGPGPGDAPTIVFLHEGLGCIALWRDFADRLTLASGWGGFLYSRAGFGGSSARALPVPLDYHHRDALDVLPRVLDAVGIGRCVLFGHSDGGTLALIYAGTVRDPRIAGLITVAAHVFNEDVTIVGIEAAKEAFRTTDLREKLRRHHGANVDGAFRGWCDVWLDPGFRAWNVEHALAGIGVPVLVVQGADDQYGTAAQVDAIARGVAGPAERLILADCGHSPHLEAPDALLRASLAFLKGLS